MSTKKYVSNNMRRIIWFSPPFPPSPPTALAYMEDLSSDKMLLLYMVRVKDNAAGSVIMLVAGVVVAESTSEYSDEDVLVLLLAWR